MMMASQLKEALEKLIKEFGDLPVGVHNPEFGSYFPLREVFFREAMRKGKVGLMNDAKELDLWFIAIR